MLLEVNTGYVIWYVRSGSLRFFLVMSVYFRLRGYIRLGQLSLGYDMSGQVSSGYVKLYQLTSDYVRLGSI
jgi:hypothetical protein